MNVSHPALDSFHTFYSFIVSVWLIWAGHSVGLEVWSLLLQVLVVGGDGHKLHRGEDDDPSVKTSFGLLMSFEHAVSGFTLYW